MSRIEFAEHSAVQTLIRPHVGELSAAEHGAFSLGHLDPYAANAHAALRTEPVIGVSLTTSLGRRKVLLRARAFSDQIGEASVQSVNEFA
jgi:hypothetical protein